MPQAQINASETRSLYKLAAIASLLAMSTNLVDVILGFGETDIIVNGRV